MDAACSSRPPTERQPPIFRGRSEPRPCWTPPHLLWVVSSADRVETQSDPAIETLNLNGLHVRCESPRLVHSPRSPTRWAVKPLSTSPRRNRSVRPMPHTRSALPRWVRPLQDRQWEQASWTSGEGTFVRARQCGLTSRAAANLPILVAISPFVTIVRPQGPPQFH